MGNMFKLIIRCDDVSYFTKPEELEMWFKNIWDKVPINLAVIPFIKANGNETPLEKRDGDLYAIYWNKELVNYIRRKIKQGKVNIWMHGLTHSNYYGKLECETNVHSSFLLRNWKEVMEETFKTKIKVFVAPHDRFSRKYIVMVEKLKMDICRAFAPLPREFRFRYEYFNNFWELSNLYFFYRTKYRWHRWMNYGKHNELYSYRIGDIKNIDEILEWHKKGILCITVHHRSMNLHDLEKLKYIIKKVKNGS